MGFFGSRNASARHAQKRYIKALKQMQERASWTPARRKQMMKGIQGFISKYINAGQERAARTGATMGRGGGYYGRESERLRREGLEYGAKALSTTFSPPPMPGVSYGAFQGYQGTNMGDILGQILGLGGGLSLAKLIPGLLS